MSFDRETCQPRSEISVHWYIDRFWLCQSQAAIKNIAKIKSSTAARHRPQNMMSLSGPVSMSQIYLLLHVQTSLVWQPFCLGPFREIK